MICNKNVSTLLIFTLFMLSGCKFTFDSKQSHGKIETHSVSKNLKDSILGYSNLEIDPERIQHLGVSLDKVIKHNLTKKIRTVGIVEVDERLIAHIQTKFTGWIEDLYVDFVGMPVKTGQPLFSVYSQELFATQEEYLLALNDLHHPVTGKFASTFKQSSMDLLHATRNRLELWDISPEQILLLEKTQRPMKTLLINSPIDGIVMSKTGFLGMNVAPGINTYTIADLSYIWVLADIYEDNISFVRLGQKAQLTLPSFPNQTFKGKSSFIDFVVDPSTRTTKIRFEFVNINYLLKPGMYATIEFDLEMGKHLALPEEALIDTGERKIVFVSHGEGRFEPREVKLGFKAEKFYQVLEGLEENETVVTSAQFLFDSESRLKALEKTGIKNHKM